MIVHRDYRDSSDSVIKIFDDRIEFFNPGDLYDDLTIEQLINNEYKSKTRNKLIALMFKECGLIEKYGSGIGRIKKFCEEHNIVAPKFEEMQKGFQVTLYKKVLETTPKTTQEKLLCLIQKNKDITREELSQKLSIGINGVKQHILKLKKEAKLIRHGDNRNGYWEVLDTK